MRKGNNDITYGIIYLSPKKEIPLRGNASISAAKIIFECFNIQNRFEIHKEPMYRKFIQK
jgi:hypothetical protein